MLNVLFRVIVDPSAAMLVTKNVPLFPAVPEPEIVIKRPIPIVKKFNLVALSAVDNPVAVNATFVFADTTVLLSIGEILVFVAVELLILL